MRGAHGGVTIVRVLCANSERYRASECACDGARVLASKRRRSGDDRSRRRRRDATSFGATSGTRGGKKDRSLGLECPPHRTRCWTGRRVRDAVVVRIRARNVRCRIEQKERRKLRRPTRAREAGGRYASGRGSQICRVGARRTALGTRRYRKIRGAPPSWGCRGVW